jgi:SAM-dependent methyltransferase
MNPEEFLKAFRLEEIKSTVARHRDLFSADKDVLEIGSGYGIQLQVLRETCKTAQGVDIAGSNSSPKHLGVSEYDGLHLPFPDSSFDLIYSSHVMEHIKDQRTIHREMLRVLRPGGCSVHVVPTATWRVYASLLHYPAKALAMIRRALGIDIWQGNGAGENNWVPPARPWYMRLIHSLPQQRHGEFGNWLTEHFHFRVKSWIRRFEQNGWRVETVESAGMFATSYLFLGDRLRWDTRRRLDKMLGSYAAVFVLRPRVTSDNR